MQENNMTSLREMLEQLPTAKLDEMLQAELRKEKPDPNAVRLILNVLEEREAGEVEEMDAQTEAAWEQYQKRIEEGPLRPKKKRNWRRIWWGTSVAAMFVVVLMCIVPQTAAAETLKETLTRWKNDILEFLNPTETVSELDFVFETDNPAMQQIYDVAIEAGADRPLVPTWFEDEYVLESYETVCMPTVNSVAIKLTNGDKIAVLAIDIYSVKKYRGYCGEEIYYDQFERDGAKYIITRNINKWVAIWEKDDIEYFLTIDCQEETLRRILDSINVMEEF